MRRGEITALRWRSIDLDAGQLAVVASTEKTKAGCRERTPTGLRQNTWRHTLRVLAASEQSHTDSRRQTGEVRLGGALSRSEWEVGRIYRRAAVIQSGGELFSHDKCLGINPNFFGSDYGFWHYRNSGKARMTLQETATTGSRPARKFTPANIQKIKDWVAEGISREEIAKRFA